jgi:hypothetical protein
MLVRHLAMLQAAERASVRVAVAGFLSPAIDSVTFLCFM